MSFINYDTRDIQLKVVFYGPRGSGKSAALQHIYDRTSGGTGTTQKLGNASADAYYDMLLQTHPAASTIPVIAVDAVRGAGVFEALKAISKLVLSELKKAG